MPHKILIVEDEAATALDLESRLTSWGYTVLGPFSHGERALQAAAADPPDLTLMDIQLAGKMDGITTAAELRARWHVQVVYLTAFATDALLERAKATAPLGYVVKPYTERELRATLEMALAKLAVDRQLQAREAELEQFKTTLDSTQDAVFMFRPDTLKFFYANQSACERTGRSQSVLMSMHPYELFTEQDEAKLHELIAPLISREVLSLRFEAMQKHADGREMPVEAFIQYIAPAGEPPRFVLILTDIRARYEAQRRAAEKLNLEKRNAAMNLGRLRLESMASEIGAMLNSSRRLEEMLLNSVAVINSYLDLALARIWTLAPGEAVLALQASVGRGSLTAGQQQLVPVGKSDIGRIAKDRARIFARPLASDARAIDPEWVKRERVVAFAGYPLLVEHEVVGVLALYSRDDLTAEVQRALDRVAVQIALGIRRKWLQRQAEQTAEQRIVEAHENLKRVLDGSEDAVLIQDQQHLVLFANRAAELLFRKRVAVGEVVEYVLLPGEKQELDVLQSDGSIRVVELRMGATQWLGVPASITTFRDVTERNQTQELLREAKEKAEAANRAKSEFLATMSHEIRTPMNGLLGMTELLQSSRLDERQRELVDSVAGSGKALLAIINDILDLSKIEAGQMTLHEEDFELRPLVEGVVTLLEQAVGDKPLVMRTDWYGDLPARCRGDTGRLRQVLLNLVGNGVKFTPRGSVTVRVRPVAAAAGPARVRFEIVDTGVGIPADKQALLFQPFQQLDTSAARRHGGTGLGLVISRQLVQIMGGNLTVQTEAGKGSTFAFEIPLPVAAVPPAVPPPASLPGQRVLLAQDHELPRRLTRLSLEKLGCHVAAVATGREVLQHLQADTWDVVLFETRLADLDGGALAAAIRKREKAAGKKPLVRLLAIAPGGDTKVPESLAAAGVELVRESPLTPTVLAKVLAAQAKTV